MRQAPTKLQELIEPIVSGLGYELVGIEFLPQGGRGLLRIYLDAEQGIGIADCEKVSYQVSGMLDVEDPIAGEYTLEVSSPGVDRPLFKLDDFRRFVGAQVKLQLARSVAGRSRYTGILRGVAQQQVTVEIDGEVHGFAYEDIDRARLVGEMLPDARNAGESGR
jgi:ribosome maturation factor RimP